MSSSLPPFGGKEPVGLRRGRDLPPRRAASSIKKHPTTNRAPSAAGPRAATRAPNTRATDTDGTTSRHSADTPPVQEQRRTSFAFTPGRWLTQLRRAVWAILLAPARLAAALSALLEACLGWLARAAKYVTCQPETWVEEGRQTQPPPAAATPNPQNAPAPATTSNSRASASAATTVEPPTTIFAVIATPATSASASAVSTPRSTPYASPTGSPPRGPAAAPTPRPTTPPQLTPTVRGEATLRRLAAAAGDSTSNIAALADDQLAEVMSWLRAQLGASRAQQPIADYSVGGRVALGLSAALRARLDFRPTTQGYWRGLRRPQGGWGDGQVKLTPGAAFFLRGALVQLVDVDEPTRSLGRRLLLRVHFTHETTANVLGRNTSRPAVPQAWLQAYARALGNVSDATQARREAEVYGVSAMVNRLATAGAPLGAVRVPPELIGLRRELRGQLMARNDSAVRVGEECVIEIT